MQTVCVNVQNDNGSLIIMGQKQASVEKVATSSNFSGEPDAEE